MLTIKTQIYEGSRKITPIVVFMSVSGNEAVTFQSYIVKKY